MSSRLLRQYIDILAEQTAEKPDLDAVKHLFAFGQATGSKPDSTPASSSTTSPEPAKTKSEPQQEPTSAEPTAPTVQDEEPDVQALQQGLLDAGFELPRFGADGKLGPETRAAIKAAEMVLGRKPTGTVTLQELETIKQRDLATDNNNLANALTAIEAVLAKYKIKFESIEDLEKEYVLENINQFSLTEQLEIWRILSEKYDISGDAAYAQMQKDMDARAEKERIKSAYKDSQAAAARYNQGASSAAAPVEKKSTFSKFIGKLGGKKGIAKKIATRAGAAAVTGPAAVAVGTGMALWTAWDIGKALYDTFTSTDVGDLDPADQKSIIDNMKVILAYEKDPALMKTLPNELQFRVGNAIKGLKALSADESMASAEPKKTAEEPKSTAVKHPHHKTNPYNTPKSTTTTKGTLIAGEPVVPGQPLSDTQMRVMKMAMDMGNTYSPEIMAQYNKQKTSS